MNDREIIELFHTNDELALEQLFSKYYRPLAVYVYKFIDDLQVAEDLVQEVIVGFWETKKYKDVRGSLKSYLFTAVRNRAINHLESFHHARKEYLEVLDENFLFETFMDEELEERSVKLRVAINDLPAKMREILHLIIFENKQQSEVASELNISLNTVKTQYARAKQKLRTAVGLLVVVVGSFVSVLSFLK